MATEKHSRKLNVLAITEDRLFLRYLRLGMPLLNLKKNGLINNYFITDSYLTYIPDDASFNVLWLQRVDNIFLIKHLVDKVNNKYLYDIDDLLIAKKVYGFDKYYDNSAAVIQALNNCAVLTVTSPRLCSLLERHAQLPLAAKTVVCPNGFEFSSSLRTPQAPAGILWTSSDAAALTTSREPVVKAIARFAQKHDLSIYCFGILDDEIKSAFRETIDLGKVSYWHHKAVFASLPTMIGVAPLETQADQDTLDFIKGKSDLKMVEFGGFGHPGVYSQAPPYEDTDLKTGVLVANTEDAWLEGLEVIFRQGWQQIGPEQEHIIQLRHMDRLTRECWSRALEPVILERPISGKELNQWRRRFGDHVPPDFDALWNTYSMRVTRPLRNLARRLKGLPPEQKPEVGSPDEAKQAIDDIRQSISWELTGPFRASKRLIKRLIKGARYGDHGRSD